MMRDATRAIGAGTWPITLADLTPVLRRVATALVGLAALGIVAGHVANRATPVDTWWVGSLGLVSLLGLTGCILVFRLEGNPLGWIFVAGALGQGVTAVTREWAVYATATQPGALPGASWVAWVGACTGPLGLASLPLALLHFPDGRLPGRAWRPVRWLVVGALAATIAGGHSHASRAPAGALEKMVCGGTGGSAAAPPPSTGLLPSGRTGKANRLTPFGHRKCPNPRAPAVRHSQ